MDCSRESSDYLRKYHMQTRWEGFLKLTAPSVTRNEMNITARGSLHVTQNQCGLRDDRLQLTKNVRRHEWLSLLGTTHQLISFPTCLRIWTQRDMARILALQLLRWILKQHRLQNFLVSNGFPSHTDEQAALSWTLRCLGFTEVEIWDVIACIWQNRTHHPTQSTWHQLDTNLTPTWTPRAGDRSVELRSLRDRLPTPTKLVNWVSPRLFQCDPWVKEDVVWGIDIWHPR